MVSADNDFWAYSLRVYQRPGVETTCLELQAYWQLDVNMLLYCCWCAASGRPVIDSHEARKLVAQTSDWQHDVIQPLRNLRLRGKALAEESEAGKIFYAQLKVLELHAERVEQSILQAHGVALKYDRPLEVQTAKQRAGENLLAYLYALAIAPDASLRDRILQLINAVFDSVT